jgi:hypothetical protein
MEFHFTLEDLKKHVVTVILAVTTSLAATMSGPSTMFEMEPRSTDFATTMFRAEIHPTESRSVDDSGSAATSAVVYAAINELTRASRVLLVFQEDNSKAFADYLDRVAQGMARYAGHQGGVDGRRVEALTAELRDSFRALESSISDVPTWVDLMAAVSPGQASFRIPDRFISEATSAAVPMPPWLEEDDDIWIR